MTRKMAVCHVVDSFGAGGIATGVVTLVRFTEASVAHTVVTLRDDVRLRTSLPVPPSVHVLQPGPTKLVGFTLRLASLIRREAIEIVHCHEHFAWLDASLATRMTARPCVQTFHGVEMPVAAFSRAVRWKCRTAARLGSRVTAVGEASRQVVCALSGMPAERVDVIPNGVDLQRFRPPGTADERDRTALRRELGVARDADMVVQVAGLRPVKDQETLLRAWRLVVGPTGGRGVRQPVLLIVGEGECQHDLVALAQELGVSESIRFLGQRQDVDALLRACDVFVLSSISEGLSFAVLEAMACGLPVVATRVGGNATLVEDGVTGVLVPPRDPRVLADGMGRLIDQPELRQGMGRMGREAAAREYDGARMAQRYVAVYREALAAHRLEARPT